MFQALSVGLYIVQSVWLTVTLSDLIAAQETLQEFNTTVVACSNALSSNDSVCTEALTVRMVMKGHQFTILLVQGSQCQTRVHDLHHSLIA